MFNREIINSNEKREREDVGIPKKEKFEKRTALTRTALYRSSSAASFSVGNSSPCPPTRAPEPLEETLLLLLARRRELQ